MTMFSVTHSFNMTLEDIVEMFRTDQPTGLIADELLRSTNVVHAMTKGSAFYIAMKEAESHFSSDDFWTSPPQALATVIDRARADIKHAPDTAVAKAMLLDLISDMGPDTPRSRKVG